MPYVTGYLTGKKIRVAVSDYMRRNKITRYTITPADVGFMLEWGWGRVLEIDIGKRCYLRAGLFEIENDGQRNARLTREVLR